MDNAEALATEIQNLCGTLAGADLERSHFYMARWNDYKDALNRIDALADNEEHREMLVNNGIIRILANHVGGPDSVLTRVSCQTLAKYFVRKEYQRFIRDSGVLEHVIVILRRLQPLSATPRTNRIISTVLDLLAVLAESSYNRRIVGDLDGIPTVVGYLSRIQTMRVLKKCAQALANLSTDASNCAQIFGCNAIAYLIPLLRHHDNALLSSVISTLIFIGINIENMFTDGCLGCAILPIVRLMSSNTADLKVKSKGVYFLVRMINASAENYQIPFTQLGVIPALIPLLRTDDEDLKNWSATLTLYLAKDRFGGVTIVQNGGLKRLLGILDGDYSLHGVASSILHRLASNKDVTCAFITAGGVQRLQSYIRDHEDDDDDDDDVVPTVAEALDVLKNGHNLVLSELLILMEDGRNLFKERLRIAISLAHFCSAAKCKSIFLEHRGLNLLIKSLTTSRSTRLLLEVVRALHKLANKASTLLTPYVPLPNHSQVSFDRRFLDSDEMSDISFSVEGRTFYAHKSRLAASSRLFRGMLDPSYASSLGVTHLIENVKWNDFESMLRFIYNGWVDVDVAENGWNLLIAADAYELLELKRMCEHEIANHIDKDNLRRTFIRAKKYSALALCDACVYYALGHFQDLRNGEDRRTLKRLIPRIQPYMVKLLSGRPE